MLRSNGFHKLPMANCLLTPTVDGLSEIEVEVEGGAGLGFEGEGFLGAVGKGADGLVVAGLDLDDGIVAVGVAEVVFVGAFDGHLGPADGLAALADRTGKAVVAKAHVFQLLGVEEAFVEIGVAGLEVVDEVFHIANDDAEGGDVRFDVLVGDRGGHGGDVGLADTAVEGLGIDQDLVQRGLGDLVFGEGRVFGGDEGG